MVSEKRERTPQELEKKLDEQLRFLELSAESYDGDFIGEAKRLATAIRILVHDTKNSHSLLAQLGKKNKQFLNTAFDKTPSNIENYGGLIAVATAKGDEKPRHKYMALLDNIPPPFRNKWLDFETWWTEPIFTNQKKEEISRSKLILTACDQDGGAHIDPMIDTIYDSLVSGNFMGWESHSSNGKVVLISNADGAAIRQIAHEILKTFKPEYSKKPEMNNVAVIFANPSTVIGPSASQHPHEKQKVGRNQPCPCRSGKKYKKCCGR